MSAFMLLAILAGWLTFSPMRVEAQTSQEFTIDRFDGGHLGLDFRLGSNLFGTGMGDGSFGRVQSAYSPFDGGSVFGNPAQLSFLDKPQLGLEFRFPIWNGSWGLGPQSLLSRSDVRQRTDDVMTDMLYPAGPPPAYTDISRLGVGQPRQLSAFWLSWPVNEHVTIGAGYRQPLLATASVDWDGLSVNMTGTQSSASGSTPIDLLLEMTLNGRSNVTLNEISIGTGGLLERYYFGSVWWGITFFRTYASTRLDVTAEPRGSVALAGSERHFFNDPTDGTLDRDAGESNQFWWRMQAGYQGGGMGARLGFVHRTYGDRFGSSFLLSIPPRLRLWDPKAFAESHVPVFFDMVGSLDAIDADNVDLIDIDQVDLGRPTLTRQTRDYLGPDVLVRMPTTLTLGMDLPLGRHRVVINGLRYLGPLSIEGDYSRENGEVQSFRVGVQPSWGVRFGLDIVGRPEGGLGPLGIPLRILTLDLDGLVFQMLGDRVSYEDPRYRLAAGLSWGTPIADGADESLASSLDGLLTGSVPVALTLGRSYSLKQRTHVGVHVAGIPDFLMRFSIAWDVD